MEYNPDFSVNKGVDTDSETKGRAIADHRYGDGVSMSEV
jgi:hypothetical protein